MTPFQVECIRDFAEKVSKHFTEGEISLLRNVHGTSLLGQDAYSLVSLLKSLTGDYLVASDEEMDIKRARVIISKIRL